MPLPRACRPCWPACWPPRASCSPWPAAATSPRWGRRARHLSPRQQCRRHLCGHRSSWKPCASRPPQSAGACPSGSVALSGGPGQCYRQLGTPVTITSAYVGSVVTGTSHIPPGQYGFWVTLPAADLPALHALTTAAYNAQGFLGISVAGQTWLLPRVRAPFTGPLEMVLPAKDQVLLLHRLLFPGPVSQPVTAVVSPGT